MVRTQKKKRPQLRKGGYPGVMVQGTSCYTQPWLESLIEGKGKVVMSDRETNGVWILQDLLPKKILLPKASEILGSCWEV